MKKVLTMMLVLCLLMTPVMAEEQLYAPMPEEAWTDAAPSDFEGMWHMIMVRSDEPVDIRNYRFFEYYEDSGVYVNIGSSEYDICFEVAEPEFKDGYMYAADENGENGAYYFLFDLSLMGCVESLDEPGNVYYFAKPEDNSEDEWSEDIRESIFAITGDLNAEIDAAAFETEWKGWGYTDSYGDLVLLNPEYFALTLKIENGQLILVSAIRDEEVKNVCEYASEENYISFYLEDEDQMWYLFGCGEDAAVLLDDPYEPGSAMFLYTAERWAQEDEAGLFEIFPELGEKIAIESLTEVAGEWTLTHLNYMGTVEAFEENAGGLVISEDGSLKFEEDGEEYEMTAAVENGLIKAVEEELGLGLYFEFNLYENGTLVMSLNGDEFAYAYYFCRAEQE